MVNAPKKTGAGARRLPVPKTALTAPPPKTRRPSRREAMEENDRIQNKTPKGGGAPA